MVCRIPNLKYLAVKSYIDFLEKEILGCLALQRLSQEGLDTSFTKWMGEAIQSAKEALRHHLEETVGSCSVVRELMMETILDGSYPSCKDFQNSDVGTYKDFSRRSYRFCVLPCCTDPFVPEEMLKIVINGDLESLPFPELDYRRFRSSKWHRIDRDELSSSTAAMRRLYFDDAHFPHFRMAGIYKHLVKELEETMRREGEEFKGFNLKRLDGAQCPHGRAPCENKIEKFASAHRDCDFYFLTDDGGGNDGLWWLSRILETGGHRSFAKMTEISLDETVAGWQTRDVGERYEHQLRLAYLFKAIGFSCPNLRRLEFGLLSHLVTSGALLHLLFRDPIMATHVFKYNHKVRNKTFQDAETGERMCCCEVDMSSKPTLHHPNKVNKEYCPLCIDPAIPDGGIRQGFRDIVELVQVIPDIVHFGLETMLKDRSAKALLDCVKASDVYNAPNIKSFVLRNTSDRKRGPRFRDVTAAQDSPTTTITLPQNITYDRIPIPPTPGSGSMFELNPLCWTLKDLILPNDSCTVLVPFLLKWLPELRTLGGVDVLTAMEAVAGREFRHFFTDFDSMVFDKFDCLDLNLSTPTRQLTYENQMWKMAEEMALAFKDRDVYFRAMGVHERFLGTSGPESQSRLVRKLVAMLAKHFPNVRRISIRNADRQLPEYRSNAFAKLSRLSSLEYLKMSCCGHRFPSLVASGLSRVETLTKLEIRDDSHLGGGGPFVLDEIFASLVHLEEISIKGPYRKMITLDPSKTTMTSANKSFGPKLLRKISIDGSLSWRFCPDLEVFNCEHYIHRSPDDVPDDPFGIINFDKMEVNETELRDLLEYPPPANLKEFSLGHYNGLSLRPSLMQTLTSTLTSHCQNLTLLRHPEVAVSHVRDDLENGLAELFQWKFFADGLKATRPELTLSWHWQHDRLCRRMVKMAFGPAVKRYLFAGEEDEWDEEVYVSDEE